MEQNTVTTEQCECHECNERTETTVIHSEDLNVLENVLQEDEQSVDDQECVEKRRLFHVGITTTVTFALHNFPKGIATFVGTLDDPYVGGILAMAVGIHNIPEGLCVTVPIYYATGNRTKAFLWALVSGLAEMFAGFLAWVVLANFFSESIYAVLFGFVAGMMVIISTKELLPTAHRYDPDNTVVTFFFIMGCA